MTADALVIGEALVDVITTADGGPFRHPGGAAANVALGLARLGESVVLATHVGPDADGALLRSPLLASGVAVAEVHVDPRRATFVAHARVAADGGATYAFDVDWDIALSGLPDARVVHTGCLGASLRPGAEVVLEFLRGSHGRSTISYDVNVRPTAIEDIRSARERVEEFVATSDLVKASVEDLVHLGTGEAPDEVATRWSRTGPVVVLTRGADGASLFASGRRMDVPSQAVAVVDTVGAGDAFCAAMLAALADHGLVGAERRPRLHGAPPALWRQVLAFATHAAAITVSRAGAQPPTRAEIDASVRDGRR